MKKYLLYGILGIVLSCVACNKDEENITAEKENNWFAIPDRPGELGQLLYSIYSDSGVSIFVNDTLGATYKGKDAYGAPIYDFETVTEKFYIYGNREKIRFVLSSDTVAMIRATKAICNWVLPNLPPKLSEQRIKSILLTDSLLWSVYGGDTLSRKDGMTAWVSNISVETLPVGRLADMRKMDERTLKFWAGMILSVKAGAWIMENCPDEMGTWIEITEADRTMKSTFFGDGHGWVNWTKDKITGEFVDDNMKYLQNSFSNYKKGFLEWIDTAWEGPYPWDENLIYVHYKAPTQIIDVMNYIAAIYAYSDSEFKEMFAGVEGEEKIGKKRELMKQLLEKFESKFEVTRHPFTSFE